MAPSVPISDRRRVLIAGGGFAAVEAMLALRALAPERVSVTILAPDPTFAYRPAATVEAFDMTPPRAYDLLAMAGDVGASYRRDRLAAVAAAQKQVRVASFGHIEYDALVLALGARATSGVPGAVTFRDQRDVAHVRRLLAELSARAIRRIVFAVPPACSWSLPLYELALLTAEHARRQGAPSEVALVSPEATPLEMFGAAASALVAGVLAEHGVRFLGASVPAGVSRDGALSLRAGGLVEADRVVAVPQLHGPRISGVPTDRSGFVPTDAFSRVQGVHDVYAAGDMTTFPIKQGGLAARQADLIAHTIAESCGVPVRAPRVERVLLARLLGGDQPIFLRTELDEYGQPTAAALQHVKAHEPVTDSIKVFGRYLTPFLETREQLMAQPLSTAGHCR